MGKIEEVIKIYVSGVVGVAYIISKMQAFLYLQSILIQTILSRRSIGNDWGMNVTDKVITPL